MISNSSCKGAKAPIKKIEIMSGDLIEILDARLTGQCKTIDNKLYVLITHRELVNILSDCGVDVRIEEEK